MIIGLGTDIVEITRIKKLVETQGQRFKDRVFTKAEQERAEAQTNPASSYAKRFAAKEAFVKAVQTDGDGISWLDIEVINHPSGAPELKLTGKAQETLDRMSPKTRVFLSLSDTDSLGQATVIIEDLT